MYGVQYGREYSGTEATLGEIFTKLLTDSINVTLDMLNIIKAYLKIFTESISISEVYSKIARYERIFSDLIINTTSIIKQPQLLFIDSIQIVKSFIMRLNGILQNWGLKIRSTGSWTDKIRSTGSWTEKERVTSLWTEKPRQE